MKILELLDIRNSKLKLSQNNQNHIGSIHAGALFIFAESASGEYLKEQFPELKDKVIPLLRESQVKYKKIAKGLITACASADVEMLEKFQKQFLKKSRATIKVNVMLKNQEEEIVFEGLFTWFIQKK